MGHERVTVGLRAGDRCSADRAAGAATVLDDQRLSELPPSGSNTIRATMSIVLPALNGMITRIGLAGQLCAQLTCGSAGVMAAAATICRWRRRVWFKDVSPLIGPEPGTLPPV